ncbi:putative serine esterase (DUF676) domain-containing protein [Ditylenchus destructor]|nr:putative serine esterase (DUF676) domain-containing protein [Ditylenchus destructor]
MRLEVFPTFSVYIHLHEFNAIDLVHGYYQIRFGFKPNSLMTFQLSSERKLSPRDGGAGPSTANSTGISRVAKIAFREQSVELDDVFKCRVNVERRIDRFEPVLLPMQLELWYLDPEATPSANSYTLVSKRTVEILARADKSTHCHRSIFFEYFIFSAVTLTIHASVVGLRVVRTKPAPDPPISDKLRNFHQIICRMVLSTVHSLQTFVQRYSRVLTSPIKIVCGDMEKEEERLKRELEASRHPWGKLEGDLTAFSSQLSRLFNQLLQLFSRSGALREIMLAEFDQQRMKQLSEAFLFSEDTVQTLLQPTLNQNGHVIDLVKKSAYFSLISPLAVYVANADVNLDNMSVIVEQRFLPSGVSACANETPFSFPQRLSPMMSPPRSGLESPMENFQIATTPKKIFDFCLPLSALASRRQSNVDYGEDEYCISPGTSNKHLSVHTENWDKRRMTYPGLVPILKNASRSTDALDIDKEDASDNLLGSTIFSSTLKAHSLCEISPKPENERLLEPTTGTSSTMSSPVKEVPVQSANFGQLSNGNIIIDGSMMEFVRRKESFKIHLIQQMAYKGYLYSDLASVENHFVPLSRLTKLAIEQRCVQDVHLVIFVHGLEGTCEDLTAYRNYLRITLPDCNLSFLLSEVNQTETWSDLRRMAENLLDEILRYISKMPCAPTRISLICHSLGGLIVRTMCGLEGMAPLLDKLHTLMTLNSPHCGLIFNQRTASWGLTLLQWWKQSPCLDQLTLKDSLNYRETFLYKLSQNGAFGLFRNVLLVGSTQDLYVPGHSALIEQCKAGLADNASGPGAVYAEMLANINESIVGSNRHTTLVKYTVSHALAKVPKAQQVTGRAVHIAAVDDDIFIEKLISISAGKHFR